MGYSNQSEFASEVSGKSAFVPCMSKMFGAAYCPHCAQSKAMYAEAERLGANGESVKKEASKIYPKRHFFGLGIVEGQGIKQHGQLSLIHIPTNQFTAMMDKFNHPQESLRWPNPDDPVHGHRMVLNKFKKDAQYNDYKIDMEPQEHPLDMAWWASVKETLPDIGSNVQVLQVYYTWPEINRFEPAADMQVNQFVFFRFLPSKMNTESQTFVPFRLMYLHCIPAATKWDNLWRECNWDTDKFNDIMAQCGYGGAGAAPASGPSAGFGGLLPTGVASPYANNPDDSGVPF